MSQVRARPRTTGTDVTVEHDLGRRCSAFLERFDDLLGYQLHVIHRGRPVVDRAAGTDAFDRPIHADSLLAVFCATKPVTAVVAASLVADGLLCFDDPLGRWVDDLHGACKGLRIHHLLEHAAGLHGYRAVDFLLLPPDVRRFAILQSRPHPDWPIGRASAYGEYVPWALLNLVIEGVTAQPLVELVRERVTEPLELADELWVGVPASQYDTIAPRLRVGLDVTFDRPVPMMLETSRRFVTEPLPAAVGGLCSARGLARFYDALLDVLAGTAAAPLDAAMLESLLVERTARAFDPVLARAAGFGRGFMVDLASHDVGRHCSSRSFGHGGFAANAWGFADPTHDLAVAYSQTARFDAARAVHAVREPLVDLVYEQLGLVPTAR